MFTTSFKIFSSTSTSLTNSWTLLFTLFFFPSITFGLLTAEIFPWAIILSIFLYKKYNYGLILVFGYLALYSLLTLLFVGFYILPETIRSFAAYSNALVSFALVSSLSFNYIIRLIKLVKLIFIFLCILGILQHFLLIDFLDPVIKLFVPRGGARPLLASGRGVRLLSIEPARAGNELIFLYLVVRTVYILKPNIILDLMMLGYLAVVVKSSMALMFYILILLIIYNIRLLLLLPILFPLLILIDFNAIGGRAIDLFIQLSKLNSISDILFVMMKTSGNRITSIYSSFLYGINYPWGGGMGNWLVSSRHSLQMTGIDLRELNFFKTMGLDAGSRSSGFCSNLILEAGLLGLLVVLTYIWSILKQFWFINKQAKIIITIFFIKIFFIGAVGHPVAWICTIIILRFLYEKKRIEILQYFNRKE